MPSVSLKQQRLFAVALFHPSKLKKAANLKRLSRTKLREFLKVEKTRK